MKYYEASGMTVSDRSLSTQVVLEAGRADRQYWQDLWRYRELLLILAWRDVSVRYKQTAVGIAWAFVRPFLTMVVFTVVFGHIARLQSDSPVPYALVVIGGLLPWTLFAAILGDASNSVISNSNLISKVYFPRMIVPLATVLIAVIDFCVSLAILAGLMIWYAFAPGWQILLLPLFVLLIVLASLGPAIWAAAIVVKYRDFRFVVPFALQFGLYVSPVGFPSSVVPEQWRLLYNLNPMVGIIDGFRWCIVGGDSPIYLPGFLLSLGVTAFFLWLGISTFRRIERGFADMI
jgi:lipopolysaccharide transport system permease protein